jgi:hypothetical protein
MRIVVAALALALVTLPLAAGDGRDTRVFHLNARGAIEGPASHLAPWLRLNLASATVDQPEYWPEESVRLRVLMPGRGAQALTCTVQKRDATPKAIPVTLDADGVAVVTLLEGSSARLELGEYRVDVATADGKAKASATFSVVEGQLGSMSFAREWREVTKAADLDRLPAGWFLGNASGAGSRWGNGLSYKNELRVDNEPFSGDVTVVPHCMLPGCNGVVAGPEAHVHVEHGAIEGTMQVGSHSGPFQLEVVSPHGTLRHPFARSGHVERELLAVSGGMGFAHKVSLAPYEGLTQVPGRALFVSRAEEAGAAAGKPFTLASIVARDPEIHVGAKVEGARAYVWTPQPDGSFRAEERAIAKTLSPGDVVRLGVTAPMSVVTIGGRADGEHREGWAMIFPPAGANARVEAPASAEPNRDVPVTVRLEGPRGEPLEGSGVLEVFDTRVAAASPESGLASALGDGVRSGSRSITGWVDPVEVERQRRADEKAERERQRALQKESLTAKGSGGLGLAGIGAGGGGSGRSMGYGSLGSASVGFSGGAAAKRAAAAPGIRGGDEGAAHAGSDDVRRGDKKVLFVGVVRTARDGRATVRVPTPPQTGRLVVRFTALRGLDWARAETGLDVALRASVDARFPRMAIPGARLDVPASVQNAMNAPLTIEARGAGFGAPLAREVGPGSSALVLPWVAAAGPVELAVRDAAGAVIDRRAFHPEILGAQRVTYSRLAFGAVAAAPGETARTFDGPRELLRGVTTNLVTTMASWFPHTEAVTARVAAQAVMLAAIDRRALDDEGLLPMIRSGFAADVAAFRERLFDSSTGLARPWPGMPTNARWSRWAARNLRAALATARGVKGAVITDAATLKLLADTSAALDAALARLPASPTDATELEPGAGGEDVVPIEVDGQVVWRVVTDDAVTRFVVDDLAPLLDADAADADLAFAKAYDRFRFLRAFSRTGRAQLLLEEAKIALAAGLKGRAAFERLYRLAARDLLLTREPGLLQGPALLGGVYSAPMAMVRFLELTLLAPPGPITRIDRPGTVRFTSGPPAPWVKATLADTELPLEGGKTSLVVELDASKDPSEYYALVAVPSNLAITQSEDILADYKGNLLYGQQTSGASKAQLMAIPFRGSRRVTLALEALHAGASPGLVAIRHVERPDEETVFALPEVRVRGAAPR